MNATMGAASEQRNVVVAPENADDVVGQVPVTSAAVDRVVEALSEDDTVAVV